MCLVCDLADTLRQSQPVRPVPRPALIQQVACSRAELAPDSIRGARPAWQVAKDERGAAAEVSQDRAAYLREIWSSRIGGS